MITDIFLKNTLYIFIYFVNQIRFFLLRNWMIKSYVCFGWFFVVDSMHNVLFFCLFAHIFLFYGFSHTSISRVHAVELNILSSEEFCHNINKCFSKIPVQTTFLHILQKKFEIMKFACIKTFWLYMLPLLKRNFFLQY